MKKKKQLLMLVLPLLPMLAAAQTQWLTPLIGTGSTTLPNYVLGTNVSADNNLDPTTAYAGTCLWFSVENGKDYFLPYGFKSPQCTYNITAINPTSSPTANRIYGTGGYFNNDPAYPLAHNDAQSVYLPFDFTLPSAKVVAGYEFKYFNYHNVTDPTISDNTFVFEQQVDGFVYKANTPYVVVGDSTADAHVTGTGIAALPALVPATPVGVDRTLPIKDPIAGSKGGSFTYNGSSNPSADGNSWKFCGTTELADATHVTTGTPAPGALLDVYSMWGSTATYVLSNANIYSLIGYSPYVLWDPANLGVGAGRAFIAQTYGLAGAKFSMSFINLDGTVTGIGSIDNNESITNNGIYTISGQYAGKDISKLPKGIYIVNGKKVIK